MPSSYDAKLAAEGRTLHPERDRRLVACGHARFSVRVLLSASAIAFIVACSRQPPFPPPPQAAPCAGQVELPPGAEVLDQPLPTGVKGAAGAGGLCDARVVRLRMPLKVFRLAGTARREATEEQDARYVYGKWWALEDPGSSKREYRARYAVCSVTNDLSRLVSCELPPGTIVYIGTGQSKLCSETESYRPSAANQLFLNPDEQGNRAALEGCPRWRPAPWTDP